MWCSGGSNDASRTAMRIAAPRPRQGDAEQRACVTDHVARQLRCDNLGLAAIRITVRDAWFDPPEHQTWDHSPSGGRGVRLVAALSRAWGADEEVDGKTVWAELPRAS